jgi:hypothetical protein
MKRKVITRIALTVNGWTWNRAPSFRKAGPDDAVYMLNQKSGTIRFGDGTHGRIPGVGTTIGVSYQDGAGSSGNISKQIGGRSSLTRFWVVVRRGHQAIGWGKRPC